MRGYGARSPTMNSENRKKFGLRLCARFRAARLATGYNMERLAAFAGVAVPVIDRFEAGERIPGPKELRGLAKALGFDWSELRAEIELNLRGATAAK